MSESKTKSRTFNRVKRRTVSKLVTSYNKKKPQKSRCGGCGVVLKGFATNSPSKVGKQAKTQRRPERPYGGVLCSKCSREIFKKRARQ